jgi:hypothetical protein
VFLPASSHLPSKLTVISHRHRRRYSGVVAEDWNLHREGWALQRAFTFSLYLVATKLTFSSSQRISALAFSVNGLYLASAAEGEILVWSVKDRTVVSRFVLIFSLFSFLLTFSSTEPLKPTVSSPASPSTPLLPPTRSPTSTTRVNSPAGKTPFLPTFRLLLSLAPPSLPPPRNQRSRKHPPVASVVTLPRLPLPPTPADAETSFGKKRRRTSTATSTTSTSMESTVSTGGSTTTWETEPEQRRRERRIRSPTMCRCRGRVEGMGGRTVSSAMSGRKSRRTEGERREVTAVLAWCRRVSRRSSRARHLGGRRGGTSVRFHFFPSALPL